MASGSTAMLMDSSRAPKEARHFSTLRIHVRPAAHFQQCAEFLQLRNRGLVPRSIAQRALSLPRRDRFRAAPKQSVIRDSSTFIVTLRWPAVLFINSFEYNDPAEFERADDLLIRRPNAGKNHADR